MARKNSNIFNIITKADLILLAALIAIGVLSIVIPLQRARAGVHGSGASALEVRITVGSKEYGTYPLDQDQDITVSQDLHDNAVHTNIVSIQDGEVSMKYSSCKNQICVHDGKISAVGQQIICLPNRVVIEIIGNEAPAFDAVAQ